MTILIITRHILFISMFFDMETLQAEFKIVLSKKDKITREKVLKIKNLAKSRNPQISKELAHILEDTTCELSPSKVMKLQKLYDKHF